MKAKQFTTELDIGKWDVGFGGSSDLQPGADDVAELIFGEKLNGAALFTYLFRRFGYPNSGWDEYKELASYCLKTPMKGLWLSIRPYLADSTSIHWGVRMSKEVNDKLCAPRQARWLLIERLVYQWAKQWVVCGKLSPGEKRKVIHEFEDKEQKPTGWVLAIRENGDPKHNGKWLPKFRSRKWSNAVMVLHQGWLDHCKIKPVFRKSKPEKKQPWHKRKHDFTYKINLALHRTMVDLLTPTNVRDVYINCAGRVKDEDIGENTAPYFQHAGYGMPQGWFKKLFPKEKGTA